MLVAGVDGAPDGWAVVQAEVTDSMIRRVVTRKVATLAELCDCAEAFDIIAIDVPIGLLDAYHVGGRQCDREARRILGARRSSVFPAPVRSVLTASDYPDACAKSRTSAPGGRAISKQAWGIVPKIREVDTVLRARPDLKRIVLEVHPEICFHELTAGHMPHRKATAEGQEARRMALSAVFADFHAIEKGGRMAALKSVDLLDAAVACWTAIRLATGRARSIPSSVPLDSLGIPMAIWV